MSVQQEDQEMLREAFLLERFIELGFRADQAEVLVLFGVDWHQAEQLLGRGCPHGLALRILS